MKIISVVNNKGGVGKTTITRLLAEYFSIICNKRVLALDLDPQGNFSNRFLKMEIDPYQEEGKIPPIHADYQSNKVEIDGVEWDGRSSIASIFFGELVFPYSTYIENLEICPAHSARLLMAETVTRQDVVEKVYDQLARFLSLKDVTDSYDIVIIDTPPSKGPVTISAIRASTDIIIPSAMEPQVIEGIYGMIHLWKTERLRRNIDKQINLIGILPNLIQNRAKLHNDLLKTLKAEIPEYVLDSTITRRLIYAEVDADDAMPKSIFLHPEKNIARQEVLIACSEIERRMNSYVS